jgi:ABC-type multidrug transport system ATPase subunit
LSAATKIPLMTPILEAKGLSKTFRNRAAVNDLDLTVQRGQVYGLLGQNGAGKSTLIRMLLGLIFPDKGTIKINGQEFTPRSRQLLAHVGAIIERPDLYNYLSGWDNLRIFAALSRQQIPNSRLYEVLEMVGLSGREQDKVKTYSLGMKQRLGIAVALIHNPDILILDEPTNGLDPQGIAEIRKLIQMLSMEQNKTIVLSSHLLYEVEQMATHMLILHKGNKIKEGPVKELINPDETIVEIDILHNAAVIELLKSTTWQKHITASGPTQLTFRINNSMVPDINKYLVEQGAQVTRIHAKHSLENYFLTLTND